MVHAARLEDVRIGCRPAMLRGRQFVELGETYLVCADSDGKEKWQIAWADIAGVAFVEHVFRGSRMSRFDFLMRGRGAKPNAGLHLPGRQFDE
jgi:hypothetical protein